MNNELMDRHQDRIGPQELPSRREMLRVLFRHKRRIVGFFLAVVFLTSLANLLIEPAYQSESKLLIRVGRESVSMDPSVTGPTMNLFQERANEINSEIDILTSPYLARQVVDAIGLETYLDLGESEDNNGERTMETAVAGFLDHLTVSSSSDSNVIELRFRARNPALAQSALATLIERFLDRHIEVHSTQASPAFFEQHSEELLEKLTVVEGRLEQFRSERQIASIDAQKEALISQISTLETAFNDVSGQIDSSEARIAAIQSSINARPAVTELSRVTGINNPAADSIKARLVDLRFQETDLAARYPDNERALVDVRKQIRVAESELAKEQDTLSEVTTGLDRNLEAMQLDLATERSQLYAGMARLRSLRDELAIRKAQLNDLGRDEIELTRLERAVDIADQEYREYVAHNQRANISAALDSDRVSNVSVVQPASYSSKRVAPRRFLNLVLSVFIGMFGGIAIALISEMLDDSLKNREDVSKRLGLPVLTMLTTEEYQSCT